jgi:hypothetical protein
MREEIEVRMVDVVRLDKVWRDDHKAMIHTTEIKHDYITLINIYSLIHTSEGSPVIAKWISSLSFGL